MKKNYKDLGIYPTEISPGSGKKVYWKCSKGHSWFAVVKSRCPPQNSQCPYCTGRYATTENNLKVRYPKIADRWDYELNRFGPEEVLPYSHKKYFFKCIGEDKHKSFSMTVSNIVSGNDCPLCIDVLPSLKEGDSFRATTKVGSCFNGRSNPHASTSTTPPPAGEYYFCCI